MAKPKLLSELKKFTLRGNLMDMAIGYTVGAAFTTVAKSLVNDIIMPPIGWLIGGRISVTSSGPYREQWIKTWS